MIDFNGILQDLPPVFYKYQSPGAIRAVLESGALRWTNPLHFNDAFEFQRMPRFEPSFAVAKPIYVSTLLRHAGGENLVDEARLGRRSRLMLAKYRKLLEGGSKTEDLLAPLVAEMPDRDYDALAEELIREQFTDEQISEFRVLCLTTNPTNEVMWGNYAESHRGCVLGFRAIRELDSVLLMAKPVEYSDERPCMGSAVEFLLYPHNAVVLNRILYGVALSKRKAWSYEEEWRAFVPLKGEAGKAFSDLRFNRAELESVTLGLRSSPEDEDLIRKLLPRYPDAEMFRMKMISGSLVRESA